MKATIAPYKYPRSVMFTEALPKTATGKIQGRRGGGKGEYGRGSEGTEE